MFKELIHYNVRAYASFIIQPVRLIDVKVVNQSIRAIHVVRILTGAYTHHPLVSRLIERIVVHQFARTPVAALADVDTNDVAMGPSPHNLQ